MQVHKKNYKKNSWGIRLKTLVRGDFIGEDQYGNRYYQEKILFSKPAGSLRRWVLYNGLPEPSKIPPEWYYWLHMAAEAPLTHRAKFFWEKEHQQNLTGTVDCYLPLGHNLTDHKPYRFYSQWNPDQEKTDEA